ncbi:4,5-DOPA dioxygenase extradiol-like [Camellia sinensis]|uniref:4,5-DOPA dioxygenase extradiol-like n=1 Tax=Camellia sinensis TaxID=4442 RepID=UPI001036C4DB|nr:4,5-DOPA dioxygenase extradiol-like [Camellia sinensis]
MERSPPLMMDTFFIPHAMSAHSFETTESRPFLRSWKEVVKMPKPKSILIVSAHWDTSHPTVNVSHHNETMYDFANNFPAFLYQVKYPAPGAPQLGLRVKELLIKSGFETVDEDGDRGLDHAAWFPLMLMYPEADIPVCELSVQSSKDGTHHYHVGKALSPLREEGVLIIGSGGATNNVAAIPQEEGEVLPWALHFNNWLKDSLLSGRHEDVIDYEKKAPYAKMAHPEPDHFYPLLVALGASGKGSKAELIHQSWGARCLSFASFRFSNIP